MYLFIAAKSNFCCSDDGQGEEDEIEMVRISKEEMHKCLMKRCKRLTMVDNVDGRPNRGQDSRYEDMEIEYYDIKLLGIS